MLLAFPVVNAIAPFTIDMRARLLIFHTSAHSIGGSHIAASTTAAPTISGPARVVDGDTVVVVGTLLAMALLLGTALVLLFLQWKAWKVQKSGQGATEALSDPIEVTARPHPRGGYLKKAKPLDGLLREDGAADAQSAREFRTVFSMTSQASKEAMIENWMRRKGCSRSEAMRLAVEEWRRDNR
jgi:hypothetical protein